MNNNSNSLTKEELTTLAKGYQNVGLSAQCIAGILRCTTDEVEKLLKKDGETRSRPKEYYPTSEEFKRRIKEITPLIIEDYKNGMSLEKIRVKYHSGQLVIKRILKENGIPVRERVIRSHINDYASSIIEDYKNGMPYPELCKKYHTFHTAIKELLEKNNVPKRKIPHIRERVIRSHINDYASSIIEDYKNGMPYPELCKKYHTFHTAIKELLEKNNVPKRKIPHNATYSASICTDCIHTADNTNFDCPWKRINADVFGDTRGKYFGLPITEHPLYKVCTRMWDYFKLQDATQTTHTNQYAVYVGSCKKFEADLFCERIRLKELKKGGK